MHSMWFDVGLVFIGFLAGVEFMMIVGSDVGSAAAEYFDIHDHGRRAEHDPT